MVERVYKTPKGDIHYYVSEKLPDVPTLAFLPGLTADHRLFEKQTEYFKGKYTLFTWDAPAHLTSRPFELNFSIDDMARWLHEIFTVEHISKPVIVGQSMGGYIAQCFSEFFPDGLGGFVSIDSAPLQRKFMRRWEIEALKHTRLMYMSYPWELLKKHGAKGCCESEYGINNMYTMMNSYTKRDYCELVSYGFYILARTYESDRAFKLNCPVLLLCGEKDKAGYSLKYNFAWANDTGFPFVTVENAGHNANADAPQFVNRKIEEFVKGL